MRSQLQHWQLDGCWGVAMGTIDRWLNEGVCLSGVCRQVSEEVLKVRATAIIPLELAKKW